MIYEEFREATGKLESFYNKKLNNVQLEVWFDELKYYPVEKYKNAINKLLTSQQYFPALSTILECIRNARSVVDLTKPKIECKACRGTGYVLYHKVERGIDYEFACQCNCENAEGLDYDGTKIADREHRSTYYLAKGTDVFKVKVPEPTFKVDSVDFDISQIKF